MPTNKPEVVLPDWAIAAAFRELDNCQNHSNKECGVYNEIFNRALEKHRAQLHQPAGGAVDEALVTVCGSADAGKPAEIGAAFRGLETPRRMIAVELLLSLGYQWDGSKWTPPQQPAEAVAPPKNWCTTCNKRQNDPEAVFCSNPFHKQVNIVSPAIDIGKLREHIQTSNDLIAGVKHLVPAVRQAYRELTAALTLIGDGGEKGNG